jgi:hypothetical protein
MHYNTREINLTDMWSNDCNLPLYRWSTQQRTKTKKGNSIASTNGHAWILIDIVQQNQIHW